MKSENNGRLVQAELDFPESHHDEWQRFYEDMTDMPRMEVIQLLGMYKMISPGERSEFEDSENAKLNNTPDNFDGRGRDSVETHFDFYRDAIALMLSGEAATPADAVNVLRERRMAEWREKRGRKYQTGAA